jgi:hypothetical protein
MQDPVRSSLPKSAFYDFTVDSFVVPVTGSNTLPNAMNDLTRYAGYLAGREDRQVLLSTGPALLTCQAAMFGSGSVRSVTN